MPKQSTSIIAVALTASALLVSASAPTHAVAAEPPPARGQIFMQTPLLFEPSEDPEASKFPADVLGFFSAACLLAYPDPASLDRFAAEYGFGVMPEIEARKRISGNPGRGWIKGSLDAPERVELILDEGNSRACIVMTYSGDPGSYDMTAQFSLQITAMAVGIGIRPYQGPTPPTPPDIASRLYELDIAGSVGPQGIIVSMRNPASGAFFFRVSRLGIPTQIGNLPPP